VRQGSRCRQAGAGQTGRHLADDADAVVLHFEGRDGDGGEYYGRPDAK
jgi:hypothetical protein